MEKDLYPPVRAFFEGLGYSCDGEVENMDLYMEKDGLNAAVEFKQKLDFRVVQQAALRQKVCDAVFIAVPQPGDLRSRAFRDKLYLLQRLGIGLIALPLENDVPALCGLVIAGLGNGPAYPCIIHATPTDFGRENSQSLVGMQMNPAVLYIRRQPGGILLPNAASIGQEAVCIAHRAYFVKPGNLFL